MENKDVLTLYHGSKSGIDGAIAPMSRERCDFGKELKLGKQYVAITQKACDRITIIDKQTITEKERILLKQESEANRSILDKSAKPKSLVLARMLLFCAVRIKFAYFPTAP